LRVLAGLTVANESEKGVATVKSFEPFECSASECLGRTYVAAEYHVKLEEKENAQKRSRIRDQARRKDVAVARGTARAGNRESSAQRARLEAIYPRPVEAFEPAFTGHLEPRVVNGIGNGLSPSHVLFEGKNGHNYLYKNGHNYLYGTWLGGIENEETERFFSGELTILGTGQELITAE
jgi:hypothetical protein